MDGLKAFAQGNYNRGNIIYSVKVENQSESSVSAITAALYMTESVFKSDTDTRKIELLKKGEATTVKFILRPKNVCGIVEVKSRIKYYDNKAESHKEVDVPAIQVEIICPDLTSRRIDLSQWDDKIAELMKVSEEVSEIGMAAQNAFELVSECLKGMNMAQIERKDIPGAVSSTIIGKFHAIARTGGAPYAVKLEVIGSNPFSSKAILTTYAKDEKMLCGCIHRILDEIEPRVRVKDRIGMISISGDYIAGDKNKTEIKDVLVGPRSSFKVGNGSDGEALNMNRIGDKCPECGNIITAENKIMKCKACKKGICTTCEGLIEKSNSFHGYELKFRYPLCEECYIHFHDSQTKQILMEEERRRTEDAIRKASSSAFILSEEIRKENKRKDEEKSRKKEAERKIRVFEEDQKKLRQKEEEERKIQEKEEKLQKEKDEEERKQKEKREKELSDYRWERRKEELNEEERKLETWKAQRPKRKKYLIISIIFPIIFWVVLYPLFLHYIWGPDYYFCLICPVPILTLIFLPLTALWIRYAIRKYSDFKYKNSYWQSVYDTLEAIW